MDLHIDLQSRIGYLKINNSIISEISFNGNSASRAYLLNATGFETLELNDYHFANNGGDFVISGESDLKAFCTSIIISWQNSNIAYRIKDYKINGFEIKSNCGVSSLNFQNQTFKSILQEATNDTRITYHEAELITNLSLLIPTIDQNNINDITGMYFENLEAFNNLNSLKINNTKNIIELTGDTLDSLVLDSNSLRFKTI